MVMLQRGTQYYCFSASQVINQDDKSHEATESFDPFY